MKRRYATLRRSESGQAMGEYAIVVGGIAVVCAFAVLLLGIGIGGLFDADARPVRPGTFTPPSTPHVLVYPATLAECQNGGWASFPQFATEQECTDYVNGLTP